MKDGQKLWRWKDVSHRSKTEGIVKLTRRKLDENCTFCCYWVEGFGRRIMCLGTVHPRWSLVQDPQKKNTWEFPQEHG